jgi:hypothetical protein
LLQARQQVRPSVSVRRSSARLTTAAASESWACRRHHRRRLVVPLQDPFPQCERATAATTAAALSRGGQCGRQERALIGLDPRRLRHRMAACLHCRKHCRTDGGLSTGIGKPPRASRGGHCQPTPEGLGEEPIPHYCHKSRFPTIVTKTGAQGAPVTGPDPSGPPLTRNVSAVGGGTRC